MCAETDSKRTVRLESISAHIGLFIFPLPPSAYRPMQHPADAVPTAGWLIYYHTPASASKWPVAAR